MNRNFAWGLVALLVASIALNIINYYRLIDVEHRLQGLSSMVSRFSQLESDLRGIGNTLDELQREAEWYSMEQVNVSGSNDCSEGTVRLMWSFRELAPNAEVGLIYRLDENDEWREAEVVRIGGASFQSELTIPVDPADSQWSFEYGHPSGKSMDVRISSPSGPRLVLEYTIYATGADGHRQSGEIQRVDLTKLSGHFSASVVEQTEGQEWEASLYQEPPCANVRDVEFIVREASGQTHSVQLEGQNTSSRQEWRARLRLDDRKDVSAYVFRATFADGTVVEKELRAE